MTGKVFAVTTYHISGEKSAEAAEEWKRLGICAIGWSYVQNLCRCKSKEEVTERLKKSGGKYGAEDIWKFVGKMSDGDLVLAYSRNNTIAYVGEVKGPCKLDRSNVIGNPDGKFGYAYQRKVDWWNDPHHFDRYDLPEYFAAQFGKKGITVAEIDLGSKGFEGFIRVVKACASSSSKFPGINEDAIKAGLMKHLYHSLDRLEKGLIVKKAEVPIGKEKRQRPDFIAEDKEGRTVLIECKGTSGESAVDQIEGYRKEYGKGKDPRLIIVAFRINEACRLAARKARNIELVECDLEFHKI